MVFSEQIAKCSVIEIWQSKLKEARCEEEVKLLQFPELGMHEYVVNWCCLLPQCRLWLADQTNNESDTCQSSIIRSANKISPFTIPFIKLIQFRIMVKVDTWCSACLALSTAGRKNARCYIISCFSPGGVFSSCCPFIKHLFNFLLLSNTY